MVHQFETVPGRTCTINGKTYLFFSGYDYLGMQGRPEFIKLLKEGIDQYGFLHPSSRASNTQLKIYGRLEEALSAITRCADTVTFSSGYLAGQAVSKVLAGYKAVYTAPHTHPALSFCRHNVHSINFEDWSQEVVSIINNNLSDEPQIICFNSVDIFRPAIHNVLFLEKIHPQQKLIVVIDDSHGVGMIGRDGKGASSYAPHCDNVQYVFMYSLSKAFSITGGAVSCSKLLADALRQLPFYSASTAISPALAYTFLNSRELYAAQLGKLKTIINYFVSKAPGNKVLTHPELPVAVLTDPEIENTLFEKQIIISSFNYPLPTSQKANRVVLNAAHTKQDVKELCQAIDFG